MRTTDKTTTNGHGAKARHAAEAVLGEEVLAATQCGWPLQLGALAAFQAVPLIGIYLRRKGKARAGGLPERFILAVTRDRVVALAMPKAQLKGWEIKATKELRSWPRAEVAITSSTATLGALLHLTPAAGAPLELSAVDRDAAAQIAAAPALAAAA